MVGIYFCSLTFRSASCSWVCLSVCDGLPSSWLSACLSVCAFAYTVYLPAIWGLPLDPPPVLSVCLSAYTSLPSFGYLPPAPPPVLFVCLSVYLSFYLSVCLCFCLPPCHLLAAYTSSSSATVLSICLSVLLHIPPCHLLATYLQLLRLFVCLSVCAFTYTSLPSVGYLLLAPPPVRLSVCLCFCIYLSAICWLTIAPLPGLSVYPFVCLSVLLPTSLPYVGYLPKAPPPVLSVYVSVCLSALLHIPPCHLLATYLKLLRLFVCLSVCAFAYTALPSVGYLPLAPPPVLSVCLRIPPT